MNTRITLPSDGSESNISGNGSHDPSQGFAPESPSQWTLSDGVTVPGTAFGMRPELKQRLVAFAAVATSTQTGLAMVHNTARQMFDSVWSDIERRYQGQVESGRRNHDRITENRKRVQKELDALRRTEEDPKPAREFPRDWVGRIEFVVLVALLLIVWCAEWINPASYLLGTDQQMVIALAKTGLFIILPFLLKSYIEAADAPTRRTIRTWCLWIGLGSTLVFIVSYAVNVASPMTDQGIGDGLYSPDKRIQLISQVVAGALATLGLLDFLDSRLRRPGRTIPNPNWEDLYQLAGRLDTDLAEVSQGISQAEGILSNLRSSREAWIAQGVTRWEINRRMREQLERDRLNLSRM